MPQAESWAPGRVLQRSPVMLHEDCLNVRLSDYLDSRRLPPNDARPEPVEEGGGASTEADEENGD